VLAAPISGRKVLLVAAALVVVLSGTLGWYMLQSRPRAGAYIDTLALDHDSVVAIRGEQTAGRAFVEMVDLQSGSVGLRWQALLPRYQVPEGAIGVAASPNAVTVRFPREGHTQIFGFATDSARKLGSLVLGDGLAPEDDGHMADNVASLSGGRVSFEIFQPDGKPARVYAVSLMDGEVSWDRELPERDILSTWMTQRHLVIVQATATTVLRRDGHVQVVTPGGGCVVPGATDLLIHEVGGSLEAISLEDGSVTMTTPLGGATFAGLCGRRGAAIAVLVAAGGNGEIWMLGGGEPRRIVAGPLLEIPRPEVTPLSLPFAGELAAIVPVALGGRLVGVDLDRGVVAWRSGTNLEHATIVDAGDAVLVRLGDLLASVNPTTGGAVAVEIPHTRPLRAHNVAGGAVWIAGDRGLVALDAATLEPRGTWRAAPDVTPVKPDGLGFAVPGAALY
jgi:hypothetical protein